MKKITLLMLSLFLYVTGQAQTVEKRIYTQAEQQAAQEREEQKRTEEVQDSILFVEAVKSLEKLDFVVEADKLIFKHGETAYVTLNTNFFSLSDDQAVVQIAPFNSGGAERCRRHYAGRPRFEHQDENRQEGKHQLFHERYRQWYLCQCFPVLATRQPSGYRNRQPEFQFKPDNLQRLSGT